MGRWPLLVALMATLLATLLGAVGAAPAFQTQVKPFYAEPQGADSPYDFEPLLSTGDRLPRTSNPAQTVQMTTSPDGLGALGRSRHSGEFVARGADFSVFMNHEHDKGVDQDLVLDDRAKLQGAIISLLQMDRRGSRVQVESADLAYERVYDTAAGASHAPSTDRNDPTAENAFARFCAGYLAHDYRSYGFDRPIYFTGEERGGSFAAGTYDERGGSAVALFEHRGERQLHTIPGLGHFPKESVVPVAGYPGKTVLLGFEDGPAQANHGYDSQLYMYVGEQRKRSSDPRRRNGLLGGKLYALGLDAGADERDYESGKSRGRWIQIEGAGELDDSELEAAAQNAGAFDFYRLEDGDQDGRRHVIFASTGGASAEPFESTLEADRRGAYYGRLYTMAMNRRTLLRKPRLRIAYDADEAVSAADRPDYEGGNALVNPDNLSLSRGGYVVVQEDATGYGDEFMAERGRDAQIWRFELSSGRHRGGLRLDAGSGAPIAESRCIYGGGRAGTCDDRSDGTDNGTWESSGIIDTDHVLGEGSLLFDVQAHGQETPLPHDPDYGVDDQDGQLILLTRASHGGTWERERSSG